MNACYYFNITFSQTTAHLPDFSSTVEIIKKISVVTTISSFHRYLAMPYFCAMVRAANEKREVRDSTHVFFPPLTRLAPAGQSSPLRSEHEHLPESGSGAATKKRTAPRTFLSPPLTGLAPAGQSSSLRSKHERLPESGSGAATKKERFASPRTFLFPPLTGLAPAGQSSAGAAAATAHLTELQFSPQGRQKRGIAHAIPRLWLPLTDSN